MNNFVIDTPDNFWQIRWLDKYTDEWYTPKEIIDALGEFDLDPCAPMRPLWRTARVMYNKEQDGLKQKWEGRVWLNPPYSRPTIEHFITRMVEHNNGIALLFNRLDNKMLINKKK